MKICIFTETYYPVVGGGETQARLLADGLIAAGHPVMLLTRRSDAMLARHERCGAVEVHRLPPVGRGQMKKWGLVLSSLPALIRLRGQYDLLFVSGYRIVGITAVLVGRLLGKRVVLKADSQGEMSGFFFESGLRKFGLTRQSLPFKALLWLRNRILSPADAFIAISQEIAAELQANGVPINRIHSIPNSVDTTRFTLASTEMKQRLRKKLGLPQDAIIAIYTGRLVSYKGLPLLLKVWQQIAQVYKNTHLVLAGTGGLDIHNCEDDLRQYVRAAGLEPFVTFTGAVTNVPEYLQAADIFAFPTENDAFPSSLIEAMACGLPAVTTPVGAIHEIVQDDITGLIISPASEQQLYAALASLISDPDRRARLGMAAWHAVQAGYTSERVTETYLTVFQAVLAGTPRLTNSTHTGGNDAKV